MQTSSKNTWDLLWLSVHLWGVGEDCAEIRDGALAVQDGKVAWVGAQADLPGRPEELAQQVEDLHGAWVLPGLIDCHTHVVFGGQRAGEFRERLEGRSYAEIAQAGGGILSTVRATRQASHDELYRAARSRLQQMLRQGVTTVEIKSGYGLDTESECKMLQVARQLGDELPVRVVPTFLGAHMVPPEWRGQRSHYIKILIEEMLPKVKQESLATMMDGFCESIAFTVEETEQLLQAGHEHGLLLRLHMDQLTASGAAALAERFPIRSCDHLEFLDATGVQQLAAGGTVAVLLPTAYYYLQEKQLPPVQQLRQAGVSMALATDCNPGSSPCTSLLTALNMGAVLFALTPRECLQGVTQHAAQALGLEASHGRLSPGYVADFSVWEVSHPEELCYWMGYNPLLFTMQDGKVHTG